MFAKNQYMKRIFFSVLIVITSAASFAQDTPKEDDEPEKKSWFKKQNLFTGGGLNLGLSNEYTELGASPYFGYSFNKYIDVAASFNFDYISERDLAYYGSGDKLRQTVIAPGAFTRIFPVNFLYAEALYEHNFLHQKYFPPDGTAAYALPKQDVNSLLVGIGYASGKEDDNNTYYYLSVMFDMLSLPNSPYVDNLGRRIPVIKAGFNIALFQGKYSSKRYHY